MKIDVHCHILPESWPNLKERYGYGGWVQLEKRSNDCAAGGCSTADMVRDGKFFRRVEENCWNLEVRLKEMNATGVDVQVLSTVPVMFSYWAKPEDTLDLCRILNDDLARTVSKHPTRFVGLGTLPMQAPELAIQEMKRCRHELGFPGVQIGSHVNDWNLDAPELDSVFAAAEENDCALFVHPWDMEMGGRMQKYFLPWLVGMPTETTLALCCLIFGGVLQKYPNLRICFAHGGGCIPFTIGRIDHGFHVRPDLCAVQTSLSPKSQLSRVFCDSLVHDAQSLKFLVDVLGQDKVVLGTDYPFPLGELEAGKLVESMDDFDHELKDKILADNACRFLGLNRRKFQTDAQ